MSTEIHTGKLPANVGTTSSQKHAKASTQAPIASSASPNEAHPRADTVSITDKVSRLQEIEKQLTSMPAVNEELVAEIRQTMADGSLELNLDRIATRLIELETGVIPSNKK